MIQQIISAIKSEYKLIFRNHGELLVLIFAPLIYAVLYSSAYAKQVATKIPIAVIDNSNSHSSREIIKLFNASPYIDVRYEAEDMSAAVVGILTNGSFSYSGITGQMQWTKEGACDKILNIVQLQ